MTGCIYSALMVLGPFVVPDLMGYMDIYPLHSSPGSQCTMTKELHVRNRQNESNHLATQWSQHIVLCFVIWITEPMGQETESLTVSFTLTFSRRKQCRRSPSNHTLIQSERLNAQGNVKRCAVSRYTPNQPMKVLFSSDDRLRRVVVWPESRAKPQLLHSCTVAISSLSLGTPNLILRNDTEKVSYNPIRFLRTVGIFAQCNNHLCWVWSVSCLSFTMISHFFSSSLL